MKRLLVPLAALLVLLALFWRPRDPAPPPAANPPPDRAESSAAPSADLPATTSATAAPPPAAPPAASAAELQRALDAIDNLGFSFRDHAAALGGNPVGTNAEITAALRGDNAKQLKLEVPEGSTVNNGGELCDPWGTPWFFHQLSGTHMEIRSAGPDRALHSADDLVR
jgi:hypothetical protein